MSPKLFCIPDRFLHDKTLRVLIVIAVCTLTAVINYGIVSAETDSTENDIGSEETRAQALSSDRVNDFVVAFVDGTNLFADLDIRAGGFNGDSSRRFPEFAVSNQNDGPQLSPDIAVASNGDFVVVWADDTDDNGFYQIYARGFHSDGTQRFDRFTVNTEAPGNQKDPAIAMSPRGDFVVVWEDDQDGNNVYNILARGFHSDGTERFSTILINPVTAGEQINPVIAMAPWGDFVVVWEDDRDNNDVYNILARGFHSDGSELFPYMSVNLVQPGDQSSPDIAMDASGNFVVTWQDDADENDVYQIHARGFDPLGLQRFARVTVNSVPDGDQSGPFIAMDKDGKFVVTWTDDQDGNGVNQVLARGFDSSGKERIADFTVNSDSDGNQVVSDIAMNDWGDFVIPWQDDRDGNGVYQIRAAGFHSDGSRRFSDFTINETAAGQQLFAVIAMARQVTSVFLPLLER